MSTLIYSGQIVTDSEIFKADILIEHGRIAAIDEKIENVNPDEIINATGLFVLPGGIDPHVHLSQSMMGTVTSDDRYSGSKAAAFGGTTTIIDFMNYDGLSIYSSFISWKDAAKLDAPIDYAVHFNMPSFNTEVLDQLKYLPDMGINSIQLFTALNGKKNLEDDELFQILKEIEKNKLIAVVNAENGDLLQYKTEKTLENGNISIEWFGRVHSKWGRAEAVFRVCAIDFDAGSAPLYFTHLNTSEEIKIINFIQKMGLQISAETCLQYLIFTDSVYHKKDAAKMICSPPFSKSEDIKDLWKSLADGTIKTISSDHCPFLYDGNKSINYEGAKYQNPGKEIGKGFFTKVPCGLPGVGDRLPVLWTKAVVDRRLSPMKFVELTSTNPAKIFGLYPRKGCILPGADADLVLWDPNKKLKYGVSVAKHRTDYNVYEGINLHGFPVVVIQRGNKIVDHGIWLGKRGAGNYIPASQPISDNENR